MKNAREGVLRAQFFDASLLRQGGQLCQTIFRRGFNAFWQAASRVGSTGGFGGQWIPLSGFPGFLSESTSASEAIP